MLTRLRQHASRDGLDYQRVLTRYGIERLLARLCRVEGGDRYALKGAMLFATWDGFAARPTKDVDLLAHGDPSPDAIRALFAGACAISFPEDGVVFDPTTIVVDSVREDEIYQGVRLTVIGTLAAVRLSVQVDLGFGDHVYPPSTSAVFPGILAELPTATLLMYPPETVIAEKLEAMIRFGLRNSRLKDFYDLWALSRSRSHEFSLGTLVRAVDGTLRRRATTVPAGPLVGLSSEFAAVVERAGLWTGFLRRQPPPLTPPPFAQLQAALTLFLEPVLAARAYPEAARGTWDWVAGEWRSG
ncbi:MAG: nucleotidyl transferase AbiEii/AbiGii toxin family protein [Myxococcales bacterium]|nr:nucleotidyl transferase AbiEii/AbiGii toxin family protein [Myxococcales bacterium]